MRTYSLDEAASIAAQMVIIHEYFGWRIAWAGVERITLNAYRPVVSPEATDRLPHCLTLLSALMRDIDVTSAMEDAFEKADEHCRYLAAEHTDLPRDAARTVLIAVIAPRKEHVLFLADKLKCMDPLRREELVRGWCGLIVKDPMTEIIKASDRDRPYSTHCDPDEFCC
jgi:hypothetical protein